MTYPEIAVIYKAMAKSLFYKPLAILIIEESYLQRFFHTLFFAAATDQFSGYITAKSATDIYYLMHRCTHSDKASRKLLNQLFSLIGMLDTSAEDIFHALTSETTDFEDAVMIETAIRTHVDYLITRNTKDYAKSPVPICSPDQFMEILKDEMA